MTSLQETLEQVIAHPARQNRPLAVILAGHNGSGKSTMWYKALLEDFTKRCTRSNPVRGVMLVEKSATEIESRRDDTTLEPVVPTGLYRFLSQFLPTSRPYGTEENSVKLAH